jgi:hypothetical protein
MRAAIFMLFAIVAVGVQPRQGNCETAGYGAAATDEARHRAVISYNDASQGEADNEALRVCGGSGCKLAFRFGPNSCGAVAMPDNSGAWGGATRPTKEAAALAAIEACQKRTTQQCKLRGAECNGQPTTASRQSPPAAPTANNGSLPPGYIGEKFAPEGGVQKWWCPQPAFSPLNCKFLGKTEGIEVSNPFSR